MLQVKVLSLSPYLLYSVSLDLSSFKRTYVPFSSAPDGDKVVVSIFCRKLQTPTYSYLLLTYFLFYSKLSIGHSNVSAALDRQCSILEETYYQAFSISDADTRLQRTTTTVYI